MTILLINPAADIEIADQFDKEIVGNNLFRWKHKQKEDIEFTGDIDQLNNFLIELQETIQLKKDVEPEPEAEAETIEPVVDTSTTEPPSEPVDTTV